MSHAESNSDPYSIIRLPHELIMGFNYVEKETKREEEDGPQGLGKREAVPQKRKGCCGGKACKATRPATEGDGGCH